MSSWKENIQLSDLDPDTRLELTCKTCGYSWYEQAGALLADRHNKFAFLDEIENRQCCKARGCHGHIRIALTSGSETEGFQGGLT